MKKEYTKPLVTVITLIADCPIANPLLPEGYFSGHDMPVDGDDL